MFIAWSLEANTVCVPLMPSRSRGGSRTQNVGADGALILARMANIDEHLAHDVAFDRRMRVGGLGQ